ncbi:MAG: YccF domain-containing protein [Chloroflexi bacterium]|nr:YccF domain-containing protein [Chloroflexota bacterium]
MSIIGNLLWIVLGGFVPALFYLLGGIVLCLTVVGIPFGVQLFKLAIVSLVPFGRTVDTTGSADNLLSILMNVLWWVFGGVEAAVAHLVLGVLFAITIIGLPFAKQHFKLLRLSLVPFGARID